MSLDKAIKHGKEKRKPYKGAKAVDCQCRNHGRCNWCKSNRLIQLKKEKERIDYVDGDDRASNADNIPGEEV